jgi:Kdo2-lipid IVA lauroyltransferase/acyltransferase
MARKSKFQIRVEYLIARGLFGFLSMLPRRAALWICSRLAGIGYHAFGSLRRTGLRNLEIAFPEKSVQERTAILKGTFQSLGRVLAETSQFMKATPAEIERIFEFDLDDETRELYRINKEERRGVLITTGHLGNWEMLVFGFAAHHEPISYLARPLDNPLIEDLTLRIRTRFGNRPINKTNSALLAVKILRQGGILGALSDVNAHPKEGVFVPFFGVEACTISGPAIMAMRSNAAIYPAFCVWDREGKKYRFVRGALIEPSNTGDRKADIVTTTAAYTAEIEKLIRKYPDQWLWIHKRWKTRPQGEKGLY